MKSKIIETIELSDIENKIVSDFQEMLLRMKDCATQKETQYSIENIYCGIVNLISINK